MTTKSGLILIAAILTGIAFGAQGVRKPVWAGQFYEGETNALSALIDGYLERATPEAVPAGRILALIEPHAGYIYSGKTAAAGYKLVRGADIATVVILGPSHRIGFEGCSIYPQGGFETPLGVAEVDAEAARTLAQASGFGYLPEAHAEEHSVEVQVPFIQKVLPKAKIVPVVIGLPTENTMRRLAAALAATLKGRKALVVASTDMSHFLGRPEANALDKNTIALVRDLKTAALLRAIERGDNILCGGAGVVAALLYAQKMGEPRVAILKYGDSTDGGGPADRVVGYFAAAVSAGPPISGSSRLGLPFALGRMMSSPAAQPGAEFSLSADEKKELLRLARLTVETFVRTGREPAYATTNPHLAANGAAFVTLTKKGDLRGCIGYTEAIFPLYQTVIRCAIAAATEDPRFGPVTPAELEALEYEISVLTPLRRIDDPKLVQVGKHGLMITKSGRRGLLLPQVAAEYKWTREEFLAETCLKAGLPPGAWREGAEIYIFEAIVFH